MRRREKTKLTKIKKETEDKTIAKMKKKLQDIDGRKESSENQIRRRAEDNQEKESEIKKKKKR